MSSVVVAENGQRFWVRAIARARSFMLAGDESQERRSLEEFCVQETCGQADPAAAAGAPLVDPTVLIL